MGGTPPVVLQPKYGGKIIDIVSRDVQNPEDKAQALADVNGTILYIVVIVVTGYVSSKLKGDILFYTTIFYLFSLCLVDLGRRRPRF
jgi:hypothetical protein